MKTGIHPEYVEAHVRCTCGNEFTTRSTQPEIHVEICSNCHPFYTGRQKLVDTGGRVERFKRRAARRQSGRALAAMGEAEPLHDGVPAVPHPPPRRRRRPRSSRATRRARSPASSGRSATLPWAARPSSRAS